MITGLNYHTSCMQCWEWTLDCMLAGFPSLLSIALIKHPDQKQLGEGRVYSDLEAGAEAETVEELCLLVAPPVSLRNPEPPAQGQHSPQCAVHPHSQENIPQACPQASLKETFSQSRFPFRR